MAQVDELKACCKDAVTGALNPYYCPICGSAIREDADKPNRPKHCFQCPKCCTDAFRAVLAPKPTPLGVPQFCPNCGAKSDEILWPEGFMRCCPPGCW